MTETTPTKLVCIGRNYAKHAAELGGVVPDEPLIFFKPPSSLIRTGEPIVIPDGVGRVDFEGEIAVVIGEPVRNVGAEDAWDVVQGIAPLNDVTARDLQRMDDQWGRAKGFDTFCPVGEMVHVSEVDLDNLSVITRVNGELPPTGACARSCLLNPHTYRIYLGNNDTRGRRSHRNWDSRRGGSTFGR
ncbi:MAG: hypothetical protein Ct9H300mP15_08480 [Gemmatimonadota bacterium]|nr:MAG: hypothetical protein Ct9H300mP15_08480 [Gemmatimonadota bacterium]